MAKMQLKLKRIHTRKAVSKFEVKKLDEDSYCKAFTVTLRNKFEALSNVSEETDIEEHWAGIRQTWQEM